MQGFAKERRLDGQVALVTGGGRGIGRAIALALSRDGMAVAVCARSRDQLAETVEQIEIQGGRAQMFSVDVSDRLAVEELVAQVEREMGPIDFLVNNAASGWPVGLFAETDPDVWWQNLEVNLRGPVYCSRAVLSSMTNRKRGRIVNIISGIGFAPSPFMSAYGVGKTALQRFTETLAMEVAHHGIMVFAVDPGLVRTPMVEQALHCGVPYVELAFQRMLDQGTDIPPERAAQLMVFLASGRADTLSGRYIDAAEEIGTVVRRAAEIQKSDLYVLRPRV